jgi:hypothetical protein
MGYVVMLISTVMGVSVDKYNVLPPDNGKGGEKIHINCTLNDPIHFRKVEFWSNSLIARELIEIKKPNLEVYLSFCLPLP